MDSICLTHNTTIISATFGWRVSLVATAIIFLCFLLYASKPLQSQDIHFSQVDVNPILFNPAYSGFFDGTGRYGVSYRNQWASVSKAFQTMAATAEFSLKRRRYFRDGFNMGVILYSDRAGTLHYGTSAANLILSYYKAVDSRSNNIISVAIEGGIGHSGFNTDDIVLGDPTDDLPMTGANFMTVGTGFAWFYQPLDDFYIKLGLSGRNLNRPNISYYGMDDAFIERKFTTYARSEYRAWGDVSIMPLLAGMFQKNYREVLMGCDVKWYLSESAGRLITFSAGMHYRWRDAALVALAAEYNAFLFALSYDANLSRLTPASKSIGSFEVNIIYRLIQNRTVKRKAMPCPII